MRLHRFFIKEDIGNPANPAVAGRGVNKVIHIEDAGLIKQWRDVLRLKSGAEVFVFNGSGTEVRARVINLSKNSAELEVVDILKNENEPLRKVILYCSLLKHENFELVAKKATEVGVCEIVPIIAERTEKLNLREDRLEKIIKEAVEQSGRAIIPKLHEPMEFVDALAHAEPRQSFTLDGVKQNATNFIFDPTGLTLNEVERVDKSGQCFGHRKSVRTCDVPALDVIDSGLQIGIFVGPEGGWTEDELRLAESAGFKKVSLGKLTLRAETAAIVASYVAVRGWSI